MNRLYNVIFLMLFVSQASIAQVGAEFNSVLQLDKSFYVTGEIVWFKLYLPESQQKPETVINTIISDANGRLVEQFYIQANEDGHIEGYYKIPFDLESAYYRLSMLESASTRKLLGTVEIPIYNDLEVVDATAISETPLADASINLEDLNIEIDLVKDSYSPRENVRGSIQIKDNNGNPIAANLSIAVGDAGLTQQSIISTNNITNNVGDAVTINGTLYNAEKQAARASVLGMYSGFEDRIFYCSADENGKFSLQPPLFYGKRPVQFIGYQFEHQDISIELDKYDLPSIDQELIYNKTITDYIALSQQRKKIFQIYTALESQVEIEKIKYDVQDLEPDFKYVVDEYESFEYMRDFFGELITPLKFILKEDSTYRAELYNPSGLYDANTVLSGAPLFIIDGKLTRDADFVARMDMDYIETIALMYRPENLRNKFKAIGRSGVVKMTTNLRDVPMAEKDADDVFMISGLQPKAAFPVFNPNETPSQQPFFRPQLYWNPTVSTNNKGKADFSFYQSDDVNSFTIRVVAQNKNGQFGTATATYEVKARE